MMRSLRCDGFLSHPAACAFSHALDFCTCSQCVPASVSVALCCLPARCLHCPANAFPASCHFCAFPRNLLSHTVNHGSFLLLVDRSSTRSSTTDSGSSSSMSTTTARSASSGSSGGRWRQAGVGGRWPSNDTVQSGCSCEEMAPCSPSRSPSATPLQLEPHVSASASAAAVAAAAADVWALGITVFASVMGVFPWDVADAEQDASFASWQGCDAWSTARHGRRRPSSSCCSASGTDSDSVVSDRAAQVAAARGVLAARLFAGVELPVCASDREASASSGVSVQVYDSAGPLGTARVPAWLWSLADLLIGMLDPDMQSRLTMEEVWRHDWMSLSGVDRT